MDLKSPKEVYKEVLKETDGILCTLETRTESAELSSAIKTARDSFAKLKNNTDSILKDLHENAEWDALTVALYGETNAGKSTIIETLRIILGEKTKQEQQQKFRQICEKYNVDENFVERWKQKKQEVERYEATLKNLTLQCADSEAERKAHENKCFSHIELLSAQIKALPFWRRGLSFIWKIPEKTELNTKSEELSTFIAETHRLSQEHELEKLEIIAKIDSEKNNIASIDSLMKELEIHQDGAIIGDGLSDFTRESTSYEFTANGNKFVLLDVPGIEGKEELVRKPIMEAVQKAHAIFYVTRKAEPPQKGDDKTGVKGTLEKIKEHLGAQTEVWTIFNKSIKSAELLHRPQLVSEGELDSLKVLEDEMRKQLGGHYAGSLNVSAYPAFVASTDHFLPGNVKIKDRTKFLAVMDSAGILQKTGLQSLAEKIGSDMVGNTKAKIRKSNFNKANDAVIKLQENVSDLNRLKFKPLFISLEDQARDSTLQLESAADSMKNNIESTARSLINKKRSNVRESIYQKIENDIDNDDFKDYLDKYIKVRTDEIEAEFPDAIREQIKTFQEEVKDIADQFQEHVQEFLHDSSMASGMDFNLNIKIDSGVNIAGLIGTAIGAIALFFVSGGAALAFGIIGVVVSLAKSVRGFFDSNYKKSQQRKAADENIDNIFCNIEDSYVSQLENNMQKIEKTLLQVKLKFKLPAQQAEQITLSLNNSVERLKIVSKNIIKEGGL